MKANYAERAIKTIKTKMYRYMTFKQSQRCIDRLQEFAGSYNNTHHRTIDTKPELAKPSNKEEVCVSTFLSREEIPRKQTKPPYKFKVGDKVRIWKISSIFDREYDQKWSGEIFMKFFMVAAAWTPAAWTVATATAAAASLYLPLPLASPIFRARFSDAALRHPFGKTSHGNRYTELYACWLFPVLSTCDHFSLNWPFYSLWKSSARSWPFFKQYITHMYTV